MVLAAFQDGVGAEGLVGPYTEEASRDIALLHLCSSVNDLSGNLPEFCR